VLVANAVAVVVFLLIFPLVVPALQVSPPWMNYLYGALSLVNVALSVLLLKSKKWAFYGFCVTAAVAVAVNLSKGSGIRSLLGLSNPVIIYVLSHSKWGHWRPHKRPMSSAEKKMSKLMRVLLAVWSVSVVLLVSSALLFSRGLLVNTLSVAMIVLGSAIIVVVLEFVIVFLLAATGIRSIMDFARRHRRNQEPAPRHGESTTRVYCAFCGSKLIEGQPVCANCGTRIEAQPFPPSKGRPTIAESPAQPQRGPLSASVLSLIGGAAIMLLGVLFSNRPRLSPTTSQMAFTVSFLAGIPILCLALLLLKKPSRHETWGVLIIVFSALSFLSGGGYIVGMILAIVGGALAIAWKQK